MCVFPEACWGTGTSPERAGHKAAAWSSRALVGSWDTAFPCSPPVGLQERSASGTSSLNAWD